LKIEDQMLERYPHTNHRTGKDLDGITVRKEFVMKIGIKKSYRST